MAARKKSVVTGLVLVLALVFVTVVSGVVTTPTAARHAYRTFGHTKVLIDWANVQTDDLGNESVPWTMTGARMCSDGCWLKEEGAGVLHLDTLIMEGSGTSMASDGGAMAWTSVEEYGSGCGTVTMAGGIGKFTGVTATYTFNCTTIQSELDYDGNPVQLIRSGFGEGYMLKRDR